MIQYCALGQAGMATRSVGLSSSGLGISSDWVVSSVCDQRKGSHVLCCSEDTGSVMGAFGSVIGISPLPCTRN
jgi:hypothetical protein